MTEILLAERILGGDIPVPSIRQRMAHAKIIYIKASYGRDRLAMSGTEYSLQSAFDWNPIPL